MAKTIERKPVAETKPIESKPAEAKAPGQKGEALKTKLRQPVRDIIAAISAEIEQHPEREGIAIALDQLLGNLNKIIDRIGG